MTEKKGIKTVLYLTKKNRNSILALAGAVENEDFFNPDDFIFVEREEEITKELFKLSEISHKVIFGISIMTFQKDKIKKIVKNIINKNFRKKILLIAGGPHPTAMPEETLNIGFDIVVIGEGEEVFKKIIRNVFEGNSFEKIEGIAFRKNGKITINQKSKKVELNIYSPYALKKREFGSIEITRGCPWGCKYCQVSYMFGRKVRHRSIKEICKYVEIMHENGLSDVRFITPNALSYGSCNGKEQDLSIVELLLKSVRNIIKNRGRIFFGTFPSEIRPDFVNKRSLEIIKNYCDNDNLIIGGQSGSDRVLKEINRGHSVRDIYNAVELSIKAGFKVNVDIILGLPCEDSDDFNLTMKLVKNLIDMGARIHMHSFIPLPGTPYQGMRSKRVDRETYTFLTTLASYGKVYGSWENQ